MDGPISKSIPEISPTSHAQIRDFNSVGIVPAATSSATVNAQYATLAQYLSILLKSFEQFHVTLIDYYFKAIDIEFNQIKLN